MRWRTRRCLILVLAIVGFTLHATLAFVAHAPTPFQPFHGLQQTPPPGHDSDNNGNGNDNDDGDDNADTVMDPMARQIRILAPLSAIATVVFGSNKPDDAEAADGQPLLAATLLADSTMSAPTVTTTVMRTKSTTKSTATATTTTSLDPFDVAVRKYFPGAQPSSHVARHVVAALRHRNYTPTNTLLGSSICSDEINQTPNSLIHLLEQTLTYCPGTTATTTRTRRTTTFTPNSSACGAGAFQLGGLGGLPFVGTSGMTAFYHHVPHHHSNLATTTATTTARGKLVILFGPHVGISERGNVGKILRPGMQEETASCGAAVAAYEAISNERAAATTTTPAITGSGGGRITQPTRRKSSPSKDESHFDFQEDYIIDKLKKKLETLAGKEANGGDETIALVTKKMYELVWDLIKLEMDAVTSKDEFWTEVSEVALLGGIIINRNAKKSGGGQDYFQPLMLKYVTEQGEQDALGEVFRDQVKGTI